MTKHTQDITLTTMLDNLLNVDQAFRRVTRMYPQLLDHCASDYLSLVVDAVERIHQATRFGTMKQLTNGEIAALGFEIRMDMIDREDAESLSDLLESDLKGEAYRVASAYRTASIKGQRDRLCKKVFGLTYRQFIEAGNSR